VLLVCGRGQCWSVVRMRAWLRPSIQRLPAWRGGRAHGAYGVHGSGLGASPARPTPPEAREVIETTCVDVDESGEYGICVDETVEGRRRAVFVPGALPGNILRVAITGKRKKLTQGVILEVIREHRGSVEPLCMYFGACGGMQRHVVHGSPDASHSRSSLARPPARPPRMHAPADVVRGATANKGVQAPECL